jgi:uncharacterized integral membrane protein
MDLTNQSRLSDVPWMETYNSPEVTMKRMKLGWLLLLLLLLLLAVEVLTAHWIVFEQEGILSFL